MLYSQNMDKLKEETLELMETYESIISDYGCRMRRIRKLNKEGQSIDMDLQTIDMFESNLKEIEPALGKNILELELLLSSS